MRKTLLLFVGLLPMMLFGQQNDLSRINLYPPSVTSLMKYVEYPVSHRTGIPDIDIPLFTVQSGNLTLPINLSFHIDEYTKFGGFPGPAGAGWSLSSDIQISRTINGLDDLSVYGYLRTGEYKPDYISGGLSKSQTELARMDNGSKDEEPDKYYYRLLGKTGGFYFMKKGSGNDDYEIKNVPLDGVKIEWDGSRFTAVDTDGTKYYFSSSAVDSESESRALLSWKCEKIISADDSDTISFTYDRHDITFLTKALPAKVEVYDQVYGFSPPGDTPQNPEADMDDIHSLLSPKQVVYSSGGLGGIHMIPDDDEGYGHWQQYDFQYRGHQFFHLYNYGVSQIKFKNGYVLFSYDRSYELTTITILDNDWTTVRTISLVQEEVGMDRYSRTLTSLRNGDEKYTFEYNGSHEGTGCSDFWGYGRAGSYDQTFNYNMEGYIQIQPGAMGRKDSGRLFINTPSIDNMPLYGSNIFAEPYGSTKDLLKIKYPTGGMSVFRVEPHYARKYGYNEKTYHGGYRIQKISYYGQDNELLREQFFKYGENEDDCGKARVYPWFDEEYGTTESVQKVRYYNYDPGNSWNDFTEVGECRLRTYYPYMTTDSKYFGGSYINYSEVAVYEMDRGISQGKTVYKFDLEGSRYSDVYQQPEPQYPFTIGCDFWHIGMPQSVTHYRYDPVTESYDWIDKTEYTYNRYVEPERLFRARAFMREIPVCLNECNFAQPQLNEWLAYYNYNCQGQMIGCMQLAREVHSRKDEEGNVQRTTTAYTYNKPNNYNVHQITTTYHDGSVVTQNNLYPGDYSLTGMTAELVSRNVVTVPVESVVRRNGRIVDAKYYRYDAYGRVTEVCAVEKLDLSESSFRMSNKTSAGNYTSSVNSGFNPDPNYGSVASFVYYGGNLIYVNKRGEPEVTYLWGYNNSYPIAEIQNAAWSRVHQMLTTAKVDEIRKKRSPSTADWNLLETLKQNLGEGTYMSILKYQPLKGVTDIKDPADIRTTYTYDSQGRLKTVRDNDGKLIRQADYRYVNQ